MYPVVSPASHEILHITYNPIVGFAVQNACVRYAASVLSHRHANAISKIETKCMAPIGSSIIVFKISYFNAVWELTVLSLTMTNS